MKKIICMILAVMVIGSMAIPAYAVTPGFKIPDMPDIPDISDNIKFDLPDAFWNDWFREHPLKLDFSGILFGL